MTQSTEQPLYATPAANAAREAAVSVYTQYEPALYAGYLAMITQWLSGVKRTMLDGGVKALALMPDPYTVFARSPQWGALVDTYTETIVRDVLAAAYHSVLPGGVEFASRPFVHKFVSTAANKMKNVPQEVYGLVSEVIDSAVTNGASIPDITAQIEQLLSATETSQWKTRAETVAITEVHSAYVGGLHDAFAMIVEADPETDWTHRWLATEDDRTRPTHREADGQVKPFGMPFEVGGFLMMAPGDPTAPASEVIRCRCVELLETADEPTNMANRGYKDMAASAAGTILMAACTAGEFCLETHKPGLCKGQKRGEAEASAATEGGSTIAVAAAKTAIAAVNQNILRLRQQLNTERDPKRRAAITQAIRDYQKQIQRHISTVKTSEGKDRAVAAGKQQAVRDTQQQDRLDKAAATHAKAQARKATAAARRKAKGKP